MAAAKGAKPPKGLLIIIFGVPAALIVVFGVLLVLKMLRPPAPTPPQDDPQLESQINRLLDESWALYRKADQAAKADEPNAGLFAGQARRKIDELSARYRELRDNPEYAEPQGNAKPGYEWIHALGGRVAEIIKAVQDFPDVPDRPADPQPANPE